jgi:hypothetical protein
VEKIEFNSDGPSVIEPAHRGILLVRFRPAGRQELDSIFCDYGIRSGRSLQLFNCANKTFLIDCLVPCDYALKVGVMTLPVEQVVEVFRCQAPPWYHRLEEDALALARQSQELAYEVGLAELFSSMTR